MACNATITPKYQNCIAGIVSRNGLCLWLDYVSKFDCAALRTMTGPEGDRAEQNG